VKICYDNKEKRSSSIGRVNRRSTPQNMQRPLSDLEEKKMGEDDYKEKTIAVCIKFLIQEVSGSRR
jgi:hypothetical protein